MGGKVNVKLNAKGKEKSMSILKDKNRLEEYSLISH